MTHRNRRLALAGLFLGIAAATAFWCVRRYRESDDVAAAREAIGRRDFTTAGARLDNHLKTHPNDLEARALAMQAARRRRDFDAAFRHRLAFEDSGGSPDAVRLERRLLTIQQGDLAESSEL